MGSLLCVEHLLTPGVPGPVLFVSDFESRYEHVFVGADVVYRNLDFLPPFPNVFGENFVFRCILHSSHTGYLLAEDTYARRDNSGPANRLLRLRLYGMRLESTAYEYLSTVPNERIPQEALTLVEPCLLRAFDGFVEFSALIDRPVEDPNLWRCLILRFDVRTREWDGWMEEMRVGDGTVAGPIISMRNGNTPQLL